jgi:hypothetical protein
MKAFDIVTVTLTYDDTTVFSKADMVRKKFADADVKKHPGFGSVWNLPSSTPTCKAIDQGSNIVIKVSLPLDDTSSNPTGRMMVYNRKRTLLAYIEEPPNPTAYKVLRRTIHQEKHLMG